MTKKQNT